jgi:hypothetical protein
MGGQCLGPSVEASEDEVDILRRQALYALLNYVVRELVANTLEHFAAELFGHHNLLIVFPYVKSLKQRQKNETETK